MYFLNEEALDVYDQFDKRICTKLNNLWQNGQFLKMKTKLQFQRKERRDIWYYRLAVMLFVMYSYIRQQLFHSYGPVPRLIPKQYMDYAIIVWGHVSNVLFLLAFYEHFTFFAENYSVNGTEFKKVLCNFFKAM